MMLACSDDDDNNMIPNKTIVDVVVESSDFSTLESTVLKANLASTLSGNGPFTVFAPDNESFTASGVTSIVIEGLAADQLKVILTDHTCSSEVNAASSPTGMITAVKTAQEQEIYVTKDNMGVFVNGWKVKQADVMASNG